MSKRNNKADARLFVPVPYEWIKAIKRLNQKDGYALTMAIFDYAIYGTEPDQASGTVSIIFDTAIKPFADSMELEYYTKAIKGAYKHASEKAECLPYLEWFAEWLADLDVENKIKERLTRLKELELDYNAQEEQTKQNAEEQTKNPQTIGEKAYNNFVSKNRI